MRRAAAPPRRLPGFRAGGHASFRLSSHLSRYGLNSRKNFADPAAGRVMGLVAPLGELLQPTAERLNDSCNAKPDVGGAHERLNRAGPLATMLNLGGSAGPSPVNTYAAPEALALSSGVLLTPVVLLDSKIAPITTVSPLTVTE
jgi:hypothetical protein